MRIIGGRYKGRTVKPPRDLPVRPTTDFAKTGLFNILANRLDFEGIAVLDLFSGTGHISLEFGSRGAARVVAVDQNFKCASFLRGTADQWGLPVLVVKSDVLAFLDSAGGQSFDIIFADPPYDYPQTEKIHELVYSKGLLNPNGTLIIEHGARKDLSYLNCFLEKRKYGNVNFSFFANA